MASTESPSRVETVAAEAAAKIAVVREVLDRHQLAGVRLRGQDWFAWATCGGSNGIALASDNGVADVLVTPANAWVLTDAIEAQRLRAEEVPEALEVVDFGWTRPGEREDFVREAIKGGRLASDRPGRDEVALPDRLVAEKRRLRPGETERYRELGRAAAEAMTETLRQVTPETTELEVGGISADAMLRRGIDPALVLVAGSRRLDLYRHPRPTPDRIGDHVCVIVCGRRTGLYANLTRFAFFRRPTPIERQYAEVVAMVEAAAWDASRPGATLGDVFAAIVDAYARYGHPGAERGHHQGGTTGYRSREVVATPGDPAEIVPSVALAWNPSLPGSKIEDTVLRSADRLEVLTVDPTWPTMEVTGRPRPDLRIID
ncbi:MAG: M24 family metallopeptidase [Candidatus Limnocylindria bacterium]